MIIRNDGDVERMQADGQLSVGDADEVRRFSDFLCEMSDAGIRPGKPRTPEEQAKVRTIYLKHYPEYATPKEDQP